MFSVLMACSVGRIGKYALRPTKLLYIFHVRKKNVEKMKKNRFFEVNVWWNEKKDVILRRFLWDFGRIVPEILESQRGKMMYSLTLLSTYFQEEKVIANPQNGGQGGRDRRPREKEMPNRINDKIRGVKEVRLVGENVEQGIYTYQEAMRMADEQNLDLVEISATANPPVCRILDYQKYLYQQKKKQKEAKANSAKVVIKEIRFGPQTDEHDYNFKLKHAQEFLKEGSKVKAYVFFKGRSILFKEQGELLLARFCQDLEEYGKPDKVPTLEGKRMIVNLTPKK